MTTATTKFHERPPAPVAIQRKRLVESMAEKYGVDADKMLTTLKATCFRQKTGPEVTTEQMMMLLVVANEYNLNPFTREIYAFPSQQGIVPIVSIDGWIRIVNEHPKFRGVAFEYGPPHEDEKFHGAPEWVQCTMTRIDWQAPVIIREYLVECYRDTTPWNTTTSRMLRHRSYIQCGRVAFGFALHDEDEAERIIEGESIRVSEAPAAIGRINAEVSGKAPIEGEATAEPDLFAGANGVPTKTDVLAKIAAATTGADFDLCRDLARDLMEPDEMDAMISKRMKELAAQAVKK